MSVRAYTTWAPRPRLPKRTCSHCYKVPFVATHISFIVYLYYYSSVYTRRVASFVRCPVRIIDLNDDKVDSINPPFDVPFVPFYTETRRNLKANLIIVYIVEMSEWTRMRYDSAIATVYYTIIPNPFGRGVRQQKACAFVQL